MKNIRMFTFVFFLSLFLPKLEAAQELPFSAKDTRVSMDFQNTDLRDILKILSVQSGMSFIASDSVKARTLSLYFEDVSLNDAVDKIFKANNLIYELDESSNIFIIKEKEAVPPEAELITKVFYLKFASVSVSPLIKERDNAKSIKSISDAGESQSSTAGGVGGGAFPGGISGGKQAQGESGITGVVKQLLSAKGSVVEDPRTNSLIVTDTQSHIKAIGDVINSLDTAQPQVLLEVEMLDVSKDATEKLGLKFGTSPLTLNTVLTGASWGSKFPLGSPLGSREKNLTNGSFAVNNQEYGSDYGSASIYQIVLDFLKTQVGTKFLARPRLLTLNNETAEIKISANESVGVETTTTSAGSSSGAVERSETGVFLRVTPQISIESGEVTMFIIPAVAESTTGGTYVIAAGVTNTFKDPEMRYTRSMVRVKDGETVVIGGLIRRNSSETITKLPFFGDIPLLGKLFTHRYKDKDRDRELLVFITPRIIKDSAIQLAQEKKPALVEREQNASKPAGRKDIINASLTSFEKRKKE